MSERDATASFPELPTASRDQSGARERWPVANPDDPPVQRPPWGRQGPRPGPYDAGSPGRMAIVQGQVLILALIVVTQLWLITTALYELLSGRPASLGWLTLASGIGFVIGLLIWWWPRRRIRES